MRFDLQSVLRGSAVVAALGLVLAGTAGCSQQSSQGQSSATSQTQLSSANFPPPPSGYTGHDMNMGIGATPVPNESASQPAGGRFSPPNMPPAAAQARAAQFYSGGRAPGGAPGAPGGGPGEAPLTNHP